MAALPPPLPFHSLNLQIRRIKDLENYDYMYTLLLLFHKSITISNHKLYINLSITLVHWLWLSSSRTNSVAPCECLARRPCGLRPAGSGPCAGCCAPRAPLAAGRRARRPAPAARPCPWPPPEQPSDVRAAARMAAAGHAPRVPPLLIAAAVAPCHALLHGSRPNGGL